MSETKIILASKSPRRKELLATIFDEFECIPSDKNEDMTKKILNSQKILAVKKPKIFFQKQKAIV